MLCMLGTCGECQPFFTGALFPPYGKDGMDWSGPPAKRADSEIQSPNGQRR